MAQLGESKYIDELNAEAQKEFGKNYVDITEDQRNTVLRRVTARQAYKKVDPSKNQNLLIQQQTQKKLKDFVQKFKKDNKRLPSKKEIQRGTNADFSTVKKYLKEGKDYLTFEEMKKSLDPPREAGDLTPAQKKWYAANKDYLFINNTTGKFRKVPDDFMSLTTSERASVRTKYKNRATTGLNHPWVKLQQRTKNLEDFLNKELSKVGKNENVVVNASRKEWLKKNKITDFTEQQLKDIFDKFGGKFVFQGQKLLEIPGIEKEIIRLAKTKNPKQIVETLIAEKKIPPQNITPGEYGKKVSLKGITMALNQLVKQKKIPKILGSDPLQKQKDLLVKEYIKQFPKEDSTWKIARAIGANENIKMSKNFVENAIKRLGLTNTFINRHEKLLPQIKSLDKILKKNSNYIKSRANPSEKFRFLSKEYAKATKQSLVEATSQLKSRLERLGALYQGTASDRYVSNAYRAIKKPLGFNDRFAQNLIEIASRSKQASSNSAIARMLGLPANQIQLIDDISAAAPGLGVKVAGDHTDIKALMKSFPNYKKNFLRMQLISDDLNQYKKNFDRKILALSNKASGVNQTVQGELLEEMEALQKEFKKLTGYRIGGFDVEDGRLFLDEEAMTPRINELKNPINQYIRQGISNLETTSAPDDSPVKFTNIVDKLLKTAGSAAQRLNIFKNYQGTKAIQESKYVNSLGKIPRFGPIVKGLLIGGASIGGMSTLANAGETNQTEGQVASLEKSQITEPLKYDATQGSIVNSNTDQKADQNQILEYIKDNPLKVTAGSSLGFAAQEVPGAYKAARDLGRGRVRSTLGISGALRPVLTTFGTPLMTGLYEGAIGAKRLDEGETMTDILTDPVGPVLGLSLMEPLSKMSGVVRDAPKRTMAEGVRNYFNLSNVGKARSGITGQILRMGMSPRMIAGASRFLGLPGLALGLGMSGYDAYKNYQNQEGMVYNLFNRDE